MIKQLLSLLVATTCVAQVGAPSTPFYSGSSAGGGGNASLTSGLVEYWPLNDAGQAFAVSGVNPATNAVSGGDPLYLTSGGQWAAKPGKIDGNFQPWNTSDRLTNVDNATLGIGSGKSFTFSLWTCNNSHDSFVLAKWNNLDTSKQDYALMTSGNYGNTVFLVRDLSGNLVGLTNNTIVQDGSGGGTNLTQVVFGYDDAAQQIWMQMTNGVRIIKTCNGVKRTSVGFSLAADINGNSANLGGKIDEVGMWSRSLSLQDVANLFNNNYGVAYPLSTNGVRTPNVAMTQVVSDWMGRVLLVQTGRNNGSEQIPDKLMTAQNTFWVGVSAASWSNKLYGVNCLVNDGQAGNYVTAWVPLYYIYGANEWGGNISTGDVTDNGSAGNGSTTYYNTQIHTTDISGAGTSIGLVVYCYTTNTISGGYDAGCVADASHILGASTLVGGVNGGTWACYNTVAGSGDMVFTPPGQGYYSYQRTASNAYRVDFANSGTAYFTVASASDSGGAQTGSYWIFFQALHSAGNCYFGGCNWSNARHSFEAVTAGLTLQESTDLYYLVQALRVALGGGYR